MNQSRLSFKGFIKPSVPKLFLYTMFVAINPTFFKVCDGEICRYSLEFLGGFKLFQQTSGQLDLSMLFLLFGMSYITACMVAYGFNYLKEKKMMLES